MQTITNKTITNNLSVFFSKIIERDPVPSDQNIIRELEAHLPFNLTRIPPGMFIIVHDPKIRLIVDADLLAKLFGE